MTNEDFWRMFHDGGIERISGDVPGVVDLHIGINYLRAMFDGEGSGFVVTLAGCTTFEFTEYGEESSHLPRVTDLSEIEGRELEILSVEAGNPLQIVCTAGQLALAYEQARVSLDSGAAVTFEQLSEATDRYWSKWAQSHEKGHGQ